MSRTDYGVLLAAWFLLAVPAWLGTGVTLVWTAAFFFGLLVASVPLIRVGVAKPSMALALLITMNLAFWVSYLLWQLRPGSGAAETSWRVPAGPASGWVALFFLTGLYEFLVFLGAWRAREGRAVCGLGFAGLALQLGAALFVLRHLT